MELIPSLFTQDEKDLLLDLQENLNSVFHNRFYSLFNIYKTDIPSEYWNTTIIDKLKDKVPGYNLDWMYFLKYVEGSFANKHYDVGIKKTIITLLDDNKLVGGETLFFTKQTTTFKRAPKFPTVPDFSQEIEIPSVASLQVGDAVMYDNKQKHAVCKVHSGERTVLVSWFK